jgi:hypothetical protein
MILGFSGIELELLIAMCLGDGSLNGYNNFRVRHSPKQREYMEYKAELLDLFFIPYTWKEGMHGANKAYAYVEINSNHPIWRELHRLLYPEGKKVISSKVLAHCGLPTLAMLIMDDGELGLRKHCYTYQPTTQGFRAKWDTSGVRQMFREARLNVYGSESECQDLASWIASLLPGVETKIYDHKGHGFICSWSKLNYLKIARAIEGLVLPSLFYKISTNGIDTNLLPCEVPGESAAKLLRNE